MLLIANYLIRFSSWYKMKFADIFKYKDLKNNIQIVNLGSNSGKYAFDYSDTELKGMNWAMSPQAIEYDYLILKKLIPNIANNGTVLIPISPFSSILDYYTNVNSYDKYYGLLNSSDIRYYSNRRRLLNWLFLHFPIACFLFHPKTLIILIYTIFKKNKIDNVDFKNDAERWITNWKRQFNIDKLHEPLSKEHKLIQDKNINRLVKAIELCRNNNLNPILILPPFTQDLQSYFTQEVKNIYIDDFCNEVVSKTNVPLLDYTYDNELSKEELYENSFFINKTGAKLFTSKVLNDINKLKS